MKTLTFCKQQSFNQTWEKTNQYKPLFKGVFCAWYEKWKPHTCTKCSKSMYMYVSYMKLIKWGCWCLYNLRNILNIENWQFTCKFVQNICIIDWLEFKTLLWDRKSTHLFINTYTLYTCVCTNDFRWDVS